MGKEVPTPNWLLLLKMRNTIGEERNDAFKRTRSKLHNILSSSISPQGARG
jgi:hypothetical protein